MITIADDNQYTFLWEIEFHQIFTELIDSYNRGVKQILMRDCHMYFITWVTPKIKEVGCNILIDEFIGYTRLRFI